MLNVSNGYNKYAYLYTITEYELELPFKQKIEHRLNELEKTKKEWEENHYSYGSISQLKDLIFINQKILTTVYGIQFNNY